MRAAGLLRVAALALIWGSGFLWIKISLRGFSPVQLTWARLALGALVLGIVLAAGRTRLPQGARMWQHLVVAALLGNAVPYLLFGLAEQDIDSSLAGAINATTPLWTLGLALAFRTERGATGSRAAGLALGFVGALLILAPWNSVSGGHLTGAILALGASASYGASYLYMGRYLAGSGLAPTVLSAGQMLTATGLLTLALPVDGLHGIDLRGDALVALLILGVIGTGAAYSLNYRIIRDDGPLLASTVTYLLPVVAVLLGALVLGEPLSARVLVGIAIVLAGVALTRRPIEQEHDATATAEPNLAPPRR